MAPTKQQLDERAKELDVREQELNVQLAELHAKAEQLEQREQDLEQRETPPDTDALVLPDPPTDRARLVVDVDADLVTAVAQLQPSEQLSVNVQINGALRQILLSSGHGRAVRTAGDLARLDAEARDLGARALAHLPGA